MNSARYPSPAVAATSDVSHLRITLFADEQSCPVVCVLSARGGRSGGVLSVSAFATALHDTFPTQVIGAATTEAFHDGAISAHGIFPVAFPLARCTAAAFSFARHHGWRGGLRGAAAACNAFALVLR